MACDKRIFALCCFVLFVLCNTVKVAVFDQVLVSRGTFPQISPLLTGFAYKLLLVNACFLILSRCRWRTAVVAFYLLQTLYITVNVMYYLTFQGYLHISQYLGLFNEALNLATHASLPWNWEWLFIFFDLPLLIGTVVLHPWFRKIPGRYFSKPVLYGSCFIFIVFLRKWELPVETPLQIMNNQYASDISVVRDYGLLTFNFMDLLSLKGDRFLIGKINYGPEITAPETGAPHPNFVIIQVESLDANVIDLRRHDRFAAPFLHALSRKCRFFPYTLSYHLAGSTSDCEFSVINSIEPFEKYPSMKIRNYDYPNSILKQLSACGYATCAFHGNSGYYFNRTFAFKKMGFQKFYDMDAMHLAENGWGAPDGAVFEYAAAELKKQRQPFLFHLITMSSHEPFTLVKNYYHNRLFDDINDGVARNYLNSISYVDSVLGSFVTEVRAVSPNTFIFIYGDHTPTMPKCSYTEARVTMNDRLFEFVPLFIISPDSVVSRETACVASFLDVAPTIFAAGGCSGSIRSHGLDLCAGPLRDREIPFCLGVYSRKLLLNKISYKQ